MEEQTNSINTQECNTAHSIPPPPLLPNNESFWPRRPRAVTFVAIMVIVLSGIVSILALTSAGFGLINLISIPGNVKTEQWVFLSWVIFEGAINAMKTLFSIKLLVLRNLARKALLISCLSDIVVFVSLLIIFVQFVGSNKQSTHSASSPATEDMIFLGVIIIYINFFVLSNIIPLIVLPRRKIREAFEKQF